MWYICHLGDLCFDIVNSQWWFNFNYIILIIILYKKLKFLFFINLLFLILVLCDTFRLCFPLLNGLFVLLNNFFDILVLSFSYSFISLAFFQVCFLYIFYYMVQLLIIHCMLEFLSVLLRILFLHFSSYSFNSIDSVFDRPCFKFNHTLLLTYVLMVLALLIA